MTTEQLTRDELLADPAIQRSLALTESMMLDDAELFDTFCLPVCKMDNGQTAMLWNVKHDPAETMSKAKLAQLQRAERKQRAAAMAGAYANFDHTYDPEYTPDEPCVTDMLPAPQWVSNQHPEVEAEAA